MTFEIVAEKDAQVRADEARQFAHRVGEGAHLGERGMGRHDQHR